MAAGRQAPRPTSRAPGTDPDFVSSIWIDGRSVSVRLRLPTFFCAPNVAWLMVTDARRAVAAVHGVDHVDVARDGHVTAKEINVGVATDADFDGAFPGLADGGLDDLRATFGRNAFLARQHRLLAALRADGVDAAARIRTVAVSIEGNAGFCPGCCRPGTGHHHDGGSDGHGGSMKAVRLHAYNEWPSVDDVAEPEITGPLDVIVKIGGPSATP